MPNWITYNKPFCAKLTTHVDIKNFCNEDEKLRNLEDTFSIIDCEYSRAREICMYLRHELSLKKSRKEFTYLLERKSFDILFSPSYYEDHCRLKDYSSAYQKVEELSDKWCSSKKEIAERIGELAKLFEEQLNEGTFVGDGLCVIGTLFHCGEKEYLVGHESKFTLTNKDIITEYKIIYP